MQPRILSSRRTSPRQFVEAFIKYRHLLGLLIWRDLNVRYKQTVAGLLWVVLQPLLSAMTFTLIFGRLAHLPADGLPYLVFAFSGVVVWRLFASGIDRSSWSIVGEEALITKVYFPRWLLPLAYLGGALLDSFVAMVVLLTVIFCFGINPGFHLFLLPLALFLVIAVTAAVGVSIALFCCKFRDFGLAVSFALQLMQFLTPVFYSTSLFGERFKIVPYLNPLTGPIELFRLSVTGASNFWWPGFLISLAGDVLVIFIGCRVVYALEDELVDTI